jgi:hypothetical protein
VPVSCFTSSAYLLHLCQNYFRFYPAIAPALRAEPAIQVHLKLVASSADLKRLLPPDAQWVGEQEITRIWKVSRRAREQYYFHFTFGNALLRVEPARGRIVGIISEAALQAPHLMVNTYVFMTLMLALRGRGIYHLHTAAVVSPQQRLTLICGGQRAGKTTLTTALGLAGWQPISDDGVVLRAAAQGALELQAFQRDFHVAAVLLQQWPALSDIHVQYFYHDRACLDGLTFFRSQPLADATFRQVQCVLFPEITGEKESSLEPLSPGEALRRLIQQSMFFPLESEHTQTQLTLLTTLVKEASCYRLKAGTDVWENPLAAGQLLSAYQ